MATPPKPTASMARALSALAAETDGRLYYVDFWRALGHDRARHLRGALMAERGWIYQPFDSSYIRITDAGRAALEQVSAEGEP